MNQKVETLTGKPINSHSLFPLPMILFAALIVGSILPSLATAGTDSASQKITLYHVFFSSFKDARGHSIITLRRFESRHVKYYLAVDPSTLETTVLPASRATVDSLSTAQFFHLIDPTAYGRAMKRERTAWKPLQNAGLRRFLSMDSGIHLSVDLCPSLHPLTRELFTAIIDTFAVEEKPVPISIAVTGVWMNEHPGDLLWLQSLDRQGKLHIRWINHTYHHRYDHHLPVQENFILKKNTDVDAEILGNEKAMLEHGITPSLFFRFPGLVSDSAVFRRVMDYGLLPIGSDAWLAKGQQPGEGSVVLVHGNGNEPIGIKDFLKLLAEKGTLIKEKRWMLLDVDKSIIQMK